MGPAQVHVEVVPCVVHHAAEVGACVDTAAAPVIGVVISVIEHPPHHSVDDAVVVVLT